MEAGKTRKSFHTMHVDDHALHGCTQTQALTRQPVCLALQLVPNSGEAQRTAGEFGWTDGIIDAKDQLVSIRQYDIAGSNMMDRLVLSTVREKTQLLKGAEGEDEQEVAQASLAWLTYFTVGQQARSCMRCAQLQACCFPGAGAVLKPLTSLRTADNTVAVVCERHNGTLLDAVLNNKLREEDKLQVGPELLQLPKQWQCWLHPKSGSQ